MNRFVEFNPSHVEHYDLSELRSATYVCGVLSASGDLVAAVVPVDQFDKFQELSKRQEQFTAVNKALKVSAVASRGTSIVSTLQDGLNEELYRLPVYYRLADDFHNNAATKVVQPCHARVGLLGNPSDGYSGKTLSSTIENFQAIVELESSPTVIFEPNPIGDATQFRDVDDFTSFIQTNGYDGGLRLLMATTKTFWDALREERIIISIKAKNKPFRMRYSTNVPRQLGLAGSSAICTATFRALTKWYSIPDAFIPPERLASYVLRAEQNELGIAAGLQDRVSQAFDCPVFMNFTPASFAANGGMHGDYFPLPQESTNFFENKLFLLFPFSSKASTSGDGAKSSGKVHSPVRKKWEEGDAFTRTTMAEIAEIAEKGRIAVCKGNESDFIRLMNENFALRVKLFGDAVSLVDRAIIDLARSFGPDVGAKLPGSGGAILAFCPRGKDFEAFIRRTGKSEIVALKLRTNPMQQVSCEV